jgi:hypothetical protein
MSLYQGKHPNLMNIHQGGFFSNFKRVPGNTVGCKSAIGSHSVMMKEYCIIKGMITYANSVE